MSMFRCNITQRVIPLSRAFFLSALLLSPPTTFASVVDTGDVVESGGNLDIGTTAYGKRVITDETISYLATHLGNNPGIKGELYLSSTQYPNIMQYANSNELIVGASGEGALYANGSLQTGTAIIGDAGFGTAWSGGPFQTSQLILGAQANGNGSFNLGCAADVQINGDAPVLVIGDNGVGQLSGGSDDGFNCPASLVLQSAVPDSAQTYVAKTPGSTGTVNFTGALTFYGGDVMRIGLDEFDQPGGVGTVDLTPIIYNVSQWYPQVSAKLVKIGPSGRLNLNSRPGAYFYGVFGTGITADIENYGTLSGGGDTTIVGNVVNHAKLAASHVFICCYLEEGPTVTGNFTQTASGVQEVEVTAGPYVDIGGTLTVNGSAHYDGKINIFLDNGYLVEGDQFNVLSVPSGNATYEPTLQINFDTSGLNPTLKPVADVSPTGIVVRIVTDTSVKADLAISMTDSPDPVLQGQTVNYTITVTNGGPSTATNVIVNGTLSGCSFSSIASGATATCTSTAMATVAGTLTQTMTVSGNEPDPNTTNNSASASTTVNPAANLGIAMTDTPDPVLQGQTVSYDITVTNNGPSPATGVVVTGSLPSCSLGDIAPGATASCTQTVTATTAGTLTQTMTVSGNETDPNGTNNSISVSTTVNPVADLALSMTDMPDPVKKRAKLVYTLTIVNNGPSSANNVSLTDTLPADTIFDGAVPSQGTCSGTATVTCAIGTLGSGAIATVTITVKSKVTGNITNSATVTATEADPDTANNSATATTLVSGGGKP